MTDAPTVIPFPAKVRGGCPVCDGPLDDGNVCTKCQAEWFTPEEAKLLSRALDRATDYHGHTSRRAALEIAVQLGIANRLRARFVFRALNFCLPLDLDWMLVDD